MVPWGRMMTTSPARRAAAAGAMGLAVSTASVHRDPADGPGQLADDGRVEDLLLGQEAHGPADAGGHQTEGGHVEVAPVVGGQQHGPPIGDVLDARDLEAGVGKGSRPEERAEEVVGLEPDHRGHTR